jgi:hypothetical protein
MSEKRHKRNRREIFILIEYGNGSISASFAKNFAFFAVKEIFLPQRTRSEDDAKSAKKIKSFPRF